MKLIQFIVVLLLISLSACEKALDYAINDTPVIVVNSFISPSEPITVNLSQSIFITEADTIKKLSKAIVSVYCNNVYKEELKCVKAGVYQSSFIPEANKAYQIKVSSTGLAAVSAQTSIPEKLKIISFVVDSFRSNDADFRARITFNDDKKTKNYYFLSLNGYKRYSHFEEGSISNLITDTILQKGLQFINTDHVIINKSGTSSDETIDAIFGNTVVGDDKINWLVFTDNAINGTTHTITLQISDLIVVNSLKQLKVELKSINKDYYNYLKSKYSADKTKNNAFSEPIRVYNNIIGGVGIFGAYDLAVDSVASVKRTK